MARAAWVGMQLICPVCERGKMGQGFGIKDHCEVCGVSFEPEEGDFLGAMVTAYSILSVLVIVGIFVVGWLTDLSLVDHLILWTIFSTAFMLLTYRNMKGIWTGILHVMVDLNLRKRRRP